MPGRIDYFSMICGMNHRSDVICITNEDLIHANVLAGKGLHMGLIDKTGNVDLITHFSICRTPVRLTVNYKS
jgi:hypothetical protein